MDAAFCTVDRDSQVRSKEAVVISVCEQRGMWLEFGSGRGYEAI